MKTTSKLITDEQTLTGATNRFGRAIKIYDDGYGPMFIHRDSMGISGIVRAQTWEDAYSICEDEFFPEASETIEEIQEQYNFKREHIRMVKDATGAIRPCLDSDFVNGRLPDGMFVEWRLKETPCEDQNGFFDNELFQESFGFRPNGPNQADKLNHGIYAKDLNGDSLEVLTPELLASLEITLEIE